MNNFLLKISLLSVFLITSFSQAAFTQNSENMKPEDTEFYEPVPKKVTPSDNHFLEAPSDAIILFDGTDMSKWKSMNDGGEVKWKLEGGLVTVVPGTGAILTEDSYGDVQLYVEWRSPMNMEHKGQDRGNSGVFLQNRYELQVLDAWENPTYVNGMAGSIYKQSVPLVNPAKRPGEWQSYNISFSAPEFNEDGSVKTPARMTVIWNGVVVQNNTEIQGPTVYIGLPEYSAHGKAPIRLQDHNSKVSFRNIWIRELDRSE